jgi:hypothetical protein
MNPHSLLSINRRSEGRLSSRPTSAPGKAPLQPSGFHALALLLSLVGCALRAAEALAPPPTDFRVSSAFPKYITADIEFRDPSGKKWPNFFHGKPSTEAGYLRLGPGQPAAAFTLLCDKMAQEKGDQSRKVLGEMCAPDKPPVVTLTVAGLGPIVSVAKNGQDKAGQTAELSGTLDVAGRKVPVKAAATFRHHRKGDEKNLALMLDGQFTIKAADLGLKTLPASAPIAVRFSLTAYPPQAATAPKKAKQ